MKGYMTKMDDKNCDSFYVSIETQCKSDSVHGYIEAAIKSGLDIKVYDSKGNIVFEKTIGHIMKNIFCRNCNQVVDVLQVESSETCIEVCSICRRDINLNSEID